jgi:FK506-binding protein 14
MTRFSTTAALLTALIAAPTSFAATELKVTVYEGPTECEGAEKVTAGNYLSMHYTGTIDESSETGEKLKKFDSSRDRAQTFDFQIGQGSVIKGWDEGLVGLCKGAKATIVIPPEMGYGAQGAGADIPGGATLNFDVEVVDIADKAPPGPNYFKMIDLDGNGELSKEEIEAYFEKMGAPVPDALWETEDKDGDGVISWEEFSGPKGDSPMGDEL